MTQAGPTNDICNVQGGQQLEVQRSNYRSAVSDRTDQLLVTAQISC